MFDQGTPSNRERVIGVLRRAVELGVNGSPGAERGGRCPAAEQRRIVLDLSRLNAIEVLDAATRRVRIEPGARWSDVAATLTPLGWAVTSRDYGGVGVGGLSTSGGVGWLVRKHGLTIDHLLAVELVLADIAPLLDQAAQILPYSGIMNVPAGPHHGQGDPVARWPGPG